MLFLKVNGGEQDQK